MVPSPSIERALEVLPDALEPFVRRWIERLCEQHGQPSLSAEHLRALLRAVACSEFAATVLQRYWSELETRVPSFDDPPDLEAVARTAAALAQSDAPVAEIQAALRRVRNVQLLHILWRELAGRATVEETLRALSAVADTLLNAAAAYAARQMLPRFGELRDEHGALVPMVIIGMGKLGGEELNFSSDIDLIFAYTADGESDGRKTLSAQEYFRRLARNIVTLVDEVTEDGFVYRTDTRLRPFGDSGPPVVSFAALESYLQQHGRAWERYAYVKARLIGPDPDGAVHDELFQNIVSPFVYRRYLDYGVFESLREMHAMIEAEVARRELAGDVKRGPGGIREIEFIVQSLQLVRGGSQPDLQSPSLLRVVPKLVSNRGLDAEHATGLLDAYRFLRRLENFIQALRDEQTHELPADEVDRERLCLAMGFAGWDALVAELGRHRDTVTGQFKRVAFRASEHPEQPRFAELFRSEANLETWRRAFEAAGFKQPENFAAQIVGFQDAPATVRIEAIARDRLQVFLPRLLELADKCDEPAAALRRSLRVVEKILRRSAYIALLNENESAIEKLVGLCEQSGYIAREIGRFPLLLDELLDPDPMHGPLDKSEARSDLKSRLSARHVTGSEDKMQCLAQFHRAAMFRIAVADCGGHLPLMKVSDSLTILAELILEETLAVAWQELVDKHGPPRYQLGGIEHDAGFAVIAYGKLGGLELSYGSDLDIVFLHDSQGTAQTTVGERPLDNAMFFSRLVRRLVHFLTTPTVAGRLYEVDTRLRPSGRKGLLVTSVDAFARYQRESAWTWEHQALLRARPVAGSPSIAGAFDEIRTSTLTQAADAGKLREEVTAMRRRMRDELDRSDHTQFDLKQGRGGMSDIEFIVQYLVLLHASRHPSVIEFSDNIRQLDALATCGVIDTAQAAALQDLYLRYRSRQHRLVLNHEAALVPADEFSEERRAVEALWSRHLGT